MEETRGLKTTVRWSEGFPLLRFALIGGFVTGAWYYLPRVVMMGSSIAGGLRRVGTLTSCFKLGDRLVMGDRFNL